MKKCTECGHCCVIFNHVPISEFEAKMRGIRTQKDNGELYVKRKRVFWGAIGCEVYICWYFDLETRLCSIYHNRPTICRKYNCGWDQTVQNEWEKLIRGEDAACLWA